MKKPPRTRNVRRVPILGLRLLIDFMLNNLVPRYEYMISDMDFFVPFVEKSPHDTSKCWVERFPGMDDQTLADIQSIKVHTYDSLRYLMLDCDLDSGRFFIDILRLSLQVFSDTSSLGVPNDNFDLGLVLDTNYSVCLGSLTIVRIWLASKEEYRPVHLLTDRNDAHMLSNVIADYAEHVYGLLDWLVEDNTWDEKKCLILGIFGLGGQVDEMVLKLRDLYSTKTSWTNHLNVWCNVLHALTIARGRHILNVEERVLIQESMFSGQRQRKGLSKVDAYLNRMKVPTYHLEMDDLHDILGTATPFNTTSNLVWDTMRLVFDNETHSKIILRGMVMSWDVYRAVLDCSRYAPDNDDVMLNTSWWIAEMATIYSIDDYRGRLAQLAMFRIGCHGSDHISSRKDHAINIDQVQVFLVECKLVLSLGISGSQLMLLTIYRGLRRIFLYHSTYEGVFSDQAIQSAATLLVSMTTMLGVTRVLSLNHHLEKAQKLFECNMVDDAEIQGMFSNVKDGVERCEYPIIYDPLGSRQYRAEWVWTRNLTMHIMKAIAEHFDRSAHNVTIGKAVVIREMITLLTTIIIKTPELITREDSHVEGADARSIRDFLIEKVILSCADPTSERTGNEHRFNQRLVQEYSNHGLVLKLVQAQYSTSKSMSMEEFMTKSEDEHRYSGNAIESIKQAGEVLYVTLLQQFDEFDRSRYQGAPGSDFDKTHIDPIVQEDFSSNRVYFYAHNSGILKVYSEPDSEQLVFHEATSMPNSIKEPRQLNKKRHIGNDHVHIIWNESRHTYRPETISGDFGNVQIQIRPLKPGEYGISIYCDEQIRPFGPLVDGMVISADVLPAAVRATAISGHRRAVQAFFKTFIHPYVIRQQNINRIVEKYIDSKCSFVYSHSVSVRQ
ncbi:hypothetical protein LPJ74_002899 [Coemansia sp. RSA 1843]|nr:hypothetical protein LPJ74_002899 [Coemansia sp. RSA 1843]